MDKRGQLGQFLSSRRARLQPEQVGLGTTGRRRVPGLRREELAQLAGMSADYYSRLEQGRAGQPSDGVLEALAAALRLDDAERLHLFDLARPPRRPAPPPPERVRPEIQRLLDLLDRVPAMIIGRRGDVLAWNALGLATGVDWSERDEDDRNTARFYFLDPRARELYPDWEDGAAETVAYLRLAAGRHPDDHALATLIGELSMKSEDFRELWANHDVQVKGFLTKRINHPVVGLMTLSAESFVLPADPDQMLNTYTAEPGSDSEAALHRLAEIARGELRPTG
jgi:transcriptional regulator with XRE-family HTH domain